MDVSQIIIAPLKWFTAVLTSSNMLGVYFGGVTIFLIVKMLIMPFVHSHGGSKGGKEKSE